LRALKGKMPNHGLGTWIASFQALLSKHNSIGIFHFFKSLLIASSHVKFGHPLPLFTLLSCLMMPLCTSALRVSGGHAQTVGTRPPTHGVSVGAAPTHGAPTQAVGPHAPARITAGFRSLGPTLPQKASKLGVAPSTL
jgi:hypothetical protein